MKISSQLSHGGAEQRTVGNHLQTIVFQAPGVWGIRRDELERKGCVGDGGGILSGAFGEEHGGQDSGGRHGIMQETLHYGIVYGCLEGVCRLGH